MNDLELRFGPYKKPTEKTIPKFQKIQTWALEFARIIDELCPESREKSLALTKLQGVKMWANAAVALHTEEGEALPVGVDSKTGEIVTQ